METLPLKPLFDNARFNSASPLLRDAVFTILYGLASTKTLSYDIPADLRPYGRIADTNYYRLKQDIFNILQDVIPKILQIKRVKLKVSQACSAGNIARGVKNRLEKNKEQVFSDDKATHTEISPIPAPPGDNQFHKGTFDQVATRQAKSKKPAAPDKKLFDK